MILISNHFFLDFDFDFMFFFVKIIFINKSGTHCSHLSRSDMSQIGSCCLWRTEYSISSWDLLLARTVWLWGQWVQHWMYYRATRTASTDCSYRSWYRFGTDTSSLSLEAWN